jgi:hypothetical protein
MLTSSKNLVFFDSVLYNILETHLGATIHCDDWWTALYTKPKEPNPILFWIT